MTSSTRPLAVDAQIGGYRILGTAGVGGMGIVYKALDLKLNRTVALKFLPDELNLGPKDKTRFLEEARTASGLDHTNIGVIHGLEETEDGRTFIVMAYYEGLTIAEKIRRGPAAPKEALDIISQIAQGLAEAHDRGIIHRDIKPSNVIITRQGVAKIVDFGLARVGANAASTLSGGPVGTLAYMSPEQVRNEPLDRRTDIWSLGVVLAELLTGKQAFERDNVSAMLLAILEQPPPTEGMDPGLAAIVCRAVAKDRIYRYGDCREFLADIEASKSRFEQSPSSPSARDLRISSRNLKRALQHASSSRALAFPIIRSRRGAVEVLAAVFLLVMLSFLIPSVRREAADLLSGQTMNRQQHIAVLPFDNIGEGSENQEISEGLMDSLTGKLSNLEDGGQSLWVVPASEVRRRKVNDPQTALKEFGASLVVKSSLMRDNSGVHLTVNLIRTQDVRQVGSFSINDPSGDFGAMQDKAVAGLAGLMHLQVPTSAAAASSAPAAYESYLKALGYMQRYDKSGNLDHAIDALSAAVKQDPQFALGYAAMGEAYRLKYQLDKDSKWTNLALANASKATALDGNLATGYVTLGRVHSTLGQNDLSLSEFQRALQLDSRNADALQGLARAYDLAGRTSDAESAYKQAIALRPEYWDGYNSLGLFYDDHGKYDDAIAQLQHAIQLTPDNAQVYSNLGAAYLDSGDPKKVGLAEAALKKSIELGPTYPTYANLAFLYLGRQDYVNAAAACEKALQLNDKNYLVWANLAAAYEGLHEADKVAAAEDRELPLLEAAVKQSPRDSGAQARLAVLYASKNLRAKALSRVQSALALSPDDPDALANIGETYELLGDRDHALKYVEESVHKGYSMDALRENTHLTSLLSDPKFRASSK